MNKTGRYALFFAFISSFVWCSTFCIVNPIYVPIIYSDQFLSANTILDQNGKPAPNLLKLLATLDIEHDGTLNNIVQATQREWLRPAGKERWDAPNKHENKRAQVLEQLDELGCLKAVHASKKRYDRAVILGALTSRVRARLAYLVKQWESGVRFDEIVVLGGERPLHSKLESREVLLDKNNKELPIRADWTLQGNLPTTEASMIRMIFDQAELPDELKKKVHIVFVETPMQQLTDGFLRRPNTGDTVDYWMGAHRPKPGSCLIISNQPYIGYQDSVMRTFLPIELDWELETIGSCAHSDLPLTVHLDNAARWLYQEKERRDALYICLEHA